MAVPILTVGLLAKACGLSLPDHQDKPLGALVIDSRKVQPGDIFAALPGENQDGHDFIPKAVAQGCGAVLASKPVACPVPLLLVEDVAVAMAQAANAWRRLVNPRVIAVTGSSGKTTVKEMLLRVLSRQWRTHATAGNLNNHLGVPMTLLAMPGECQVAVVEMGMNHAGEIHRLAEIAQPDCGIITNIFPAHLEGLGSLQAIAAAKGELLGHLTAEKLAVLPASGEQSEYLQEMCQGRKLTFGPTANADWHWQPGQQEGEAILHGVQGTTLYLNSLRAFGQHLVTNATAVAALCHDLGVDTTMIQAGLNDFQPPAGRGAPLASTIGSWQVIDDCYNANPGSMRAALHNLAAKNAAGRKLALLGDMLELGETGPQLHAQLADDIINGGVDQLFTAGPLMANLHQAVLQRGSIPCHHQDDPAQWCGQLVHHLKEGDIILVKGSRGMRLERLVREIIGSS